MKKTVMTGVGLLLIFGLGGCQTTITQPPKAYTCDWCGIAFYVALNPGAVEWGDPCHPAAWSSNPFMNALSETLSPGSTTPCAYRVRAKTNLISDKAGHNFCSLRCLNSYLASKDIKESRQRIIRGE